MTSKKTTKTSAKWSDDVFEEFIASGMKLKDLLDEDIDPTDYSWHQMQRLCDVYHIRTGGTKDEMAKRLCRARDDAIAGLAPPSAEEKEQLDSARQQVEQSDAEETAAALEDASVMEGEKKQPHVEHQQEIIDLDVTIDQLKQDFAREIKEKFDTLKSAKENSSTTGDGRFIGFYNHKQDLRSWCADGHPDEHRFQKNGWNPVYFADTKEDIVKWVMQQPAVSTASTKFPNNGGTTFPRWGRTRRNKPTLRHLLIMVSRKFNLTGHVYRLLVKLNGHGAIPSAN